MNIIDYTGLSTSFTIKPDTIKTGYNIQLLIHQQGIGSFIQFLGNKITPNRYFHYKKLQNIIVKTSTVMSPKIENVFFY